MNRITIQLRDERVILDIIKDGGFIDGKEVSVFYRNALLLSELNRQWFSLTEDEGNDQKIDELGFIWRAAAENLLNEVLIEQGLSLNDENRHIARNKLNAAIAAFGGQIY